MSRALVALVALVLPSSACTFPEVGIVEEIDGGAGGAAGGGGLGGTGGAGDPCDADQDGHTASTCGGEDCDDADPRVFPGQPQYFTVANHKGGFDYDCNGSEETRYPSFDCTGVCTPPSYDVFHSTSVVACGQSALYGKCSPPSPPASLNCTFDGTFRPQECR